MNQTEIQLKFSSSSEIKLDGIFNSNKYEQISKAFDSDTIVWETKGPANRRNYQVAKPETVPEIISELIRVLTCDHMGLTLSNMTGLALHSSVAKTVANDEGDADDSFDDDDDDDDDEEENNDVQEKYHASDNTDDDNDNENLLEDLLVERSDQSLKRKQESEVSRSDNSSQPGTSKSKLEPNKKLKIQEEKKLDTPSTSAKEHTNQTENTTNPKCYYEIRKWKQGN